MDLVYLTTRVPDTGNMSATRATCVQHQCHTNDMSATQVRHEWDKRNMSATRMTRVQHQCCANETSGTWMKNFDFDSDTI